MLGEKIDKSAVAINTVVLSFIFLWMLTGSSWVYYDSDCYHDFTEGYYMVIAISLSFFGLIGIVIFGLLIITCLVCLGALYINQMLDKEDEE